MSDLRGATYVHYMALKRCLLAFYAVCIEWHLGEFYKDHYQIAFHFPGNYNAYETRVFSRLFYWLGVVEQRLNKQVGPPFQKEYKKTDILSMVFSFK